MNPNVFDYADFRAYLSEWFRERKQVRPRLSHRGFALKVGSKDPSLLLNVITGRRGLTPERTEAFVEALGLEGDEAEYFRLLVRFGQAEDAAERDRAWAAIAVLRSRVQAPEIDSSRFLYASNRIYPAVQSLAECEGFRPEPGWIARTLRPAVSESEAAEALELLLRLGFLARVGDRVVPAQPVMHTPPTVADLGGYGYHRQNHKRAGEVLEQLWDPRSGVAEETAFLGITLAVPESKLGDLRRLLWEAQLHVMHECESWTERDRVVQVSIQMFPVSERTR